MNIKKTFIRLILIVIAIVIWFAAQFLIEYKGWPSGCIGDAIFTATNPIHDFFLRNVSWTNALLIASSACVDILALLIIGKSLWGPTFRPFVGLFTILILRFMCQMIVSLSPPPGEIWHYPGFPSIFVTYGVSNDLFFSGHTAVAVYGAIELHRMNHARWMSVLAIFIIVFEIATVLVLRAHYFMDVYAAIITSLFVASIDQKMANRMDIWIDRITRRP